MPNLFVIAASMIAIILSINGYVFGLWILFFVSGMYVVSGAAMFAYTLDEHIRKHQMERSVGMRILGFVATAAISYYMFTAGYLIICGAMLVIAAVKFMNIVFAISPPTE